MRNFKINQGSGSNFRLAGPFLKDKSMKGNLNPNSAAPLYGQAYQNLQTELFRRHKYAEMRLSTYLSARIGIEDWTFSSADIAAQTGLNRNTVYALCDQLLKAKVFTLKVEKKGCPTIYYFDKNALLNYLQGDTAIDGLGQATCQSDTHLPANSTSTLTCQSDEHEPATSTSTSCQSDKHLPASPTGTINKSKKEDRKKTHKEETSLCAFSQFHEPTEETLTDANLSAKSKTAAFLNYVRYLNSIDVGLILSDKAENLAFRFFKDNPTKPASELTNLIDDCTCFSFSLKPHESGFDEQFNIRRSHNLTYFFEHLEAITNEVNRLKSEIGV